MISKQKTGLLIFGYSVLLAVVLIINTKAASLISGSLELTRWHIITITNKTAMFFFNLVAITWLTIWLYRHTEGRRRVLAVVIGIMLLGIAGYAMSLAVPFRL